jgi:uncharacterized protein (TIGR02246 family)
MLDHQKLVKSVFSAVDAMNPKAFAELLTADGVFAFGNMPPARGRTDVASATRQFFNSISGIKHEIVGVWNENDTVIVQLMVSYTRRDGKVVELPCANIWKLQQDKIADYRIFMDVNPVFT